MSKYYEEPTESDISNSRFHRNNKLYKEINKSELSNYDIKSNATIIGNNDNEIDVEKIKRILDTKYKEGPKRRSIRLEETEEIIPEHEITKEYDINIILEKAKEEKQEEYEVERLKKLRDTQFDILKNLNLEKYDTDDYDGEKSDLEELINTIAMNEKSGSIELDILSDLKGNDNTEVIKGLKEETEKKLDLTDTDMINSFYTSSNAIKKDDFEDMDDFSKDINNNNGFVKILIALIILVLIIGVVLVFKTLYFS